MAYATSNPPILLTQSGNARRVWLYASTDAMTLVRVSGYFTDGYNRGMRSGDLVLVIDTDASPIAGAWAFVNVSGTTIDLGDGVAITATNTD
jgi:hypothetical protein